MKTCICKGMSVNLNRDSRNRRVESFRATEFAMALMTTESEKHVRMFDLHSDA